MKPKKENLPKETKRDRTGRLNNLLDILEENGPALPGLAYSSPWELLVATVLSAQCTDVRVNIVTPGLFAAYPGPAALMDAQTAQVEELVKTCGLYKTKAKNLVLLAGKIEREHGGKVPREREKLENLPGVGRKTASVVLSQAFDIPAFAVDTHVGRLAVRLGFSSTNQPLAVEKALTALLKPERLKSAHLLLIRHGRQTCKARNPACPSCRINHLCPWPGKTKAPCTP